MRKTLIYLIKIYQLTISKYLVYMFGFGCRFNPTCSEYFQTAIQKYGIIYGTVKSLKRVLKCHPGSKLRYDPA
ncbi:membrane protein insertion efficiency factor YidD [Candidatus Woesebacteria bacterium RIFCSPHIGHO2_02_FULL_38_9]|uniref:Membrane protein insertion efficiency factor YidD n=1 Tax=Candidatus Woesebacteria bacterium RIFCSPHIGHO2_01_FULL_39_28 TaxID=1802496 RepID=A0A1F7YN42_9BACT|nr:MAG: membrane protein insertion efficiency factor YidD [Candidatus Woesebacteria bacterium RIFCSPHIGHO2_01_FULL_39_28]OGM33034.1 MAG: membrane protein insertion efficiency factor YidD [Candidatus Woesebacteria bacterium RIFCSPHIGHO2_02_FULL_38_9]OGM56698.1 MAG: membrane protein insertion efficiency factor YidD [Candidatus Woesebacteria bacterium RIFCSPLOWO2_01_FULL_38_20]